MLEALTALSILVISIIVAALIGLRIGRTIDMRHDAAARRQLIELAQGPTLPFSHDMIRNLPEPAQRYFRFTIAEGTRLCAVGEIEMSGKIGFGTKDKPNYKSMRARQILAPPYGFVWRLKAGAISGSDGMTPDMSWTRFWLFGLIPVVRVSHNKNHFRSAYGRVIAEAPFWAPASLLPRHNVVWEGVDVHTAAATVTLGTLAQRVSIRVDEKGQPQEVSIQRWSNENPEKKFREQPFGGTLSEFKVFDGYCLPTRVEGGNQFGTPLYFPFYKAEVSEVTFPCKDDAS